MRTELSGAASELIRSFVLNPAFLEVKDSFVAHTPCGGKDSDEIILNAGKGAGTVYVFNELEKLVKAKPKQKQQPNKDYSEIDPDLDEK